MGILDKLWDDTVAGPRPDSGLGRLRKPPPPPPAIRVDVDEPGLGCKEPGGVFSPQRVTRSIKIRRPRQQQQHHHQAPAEEAAGTPPLSPATPPPSSSPFAAEESGGGGPGWIRCRFRFRDVYSSPIFQQGKPRTTKGGGGDGDGDGDGDSTTQAPGSPSPL